MMVRTQKPEIFAHLDDDAYFFEIVLADTKCADLALEISEDTGHIHIEIPKWTPTVGREIVQRFAEFKRFMLEHGVRTLVATNANLEDEVRWTKFIELFGFPKPEKVLLSTRSISWE